MKTYLLFSILALSAAAQADLSVECRAGLTQVVSLDLTGHYYLTDTHEPSLKKSKKVTPTKESKNRVEFVHDFGSDSSKSIYAFEGLEKCGFYAPAAEVLSLTFSVKSSVSGETTYTKIMKCTCAED